MNWRGSWTSLTELSSVPARLSADSRIEMRWGEHTVKEQKQTTELSLEHKDVLYDRLHSIAVPLAEYSFANIYLFRKKHSYRIVEDSGPPFIRGETYDGYSFVMPTVELPELDEGVLREWLQDVDFIFPVAEQWLEDIDEEDFERTYQDGDTDYVYETEKIAELSGRKLHRKRNMLRQFERRYDHEALPLTNDRLDDARAVLEKWQEQMSAPAEETDYAPCSEALELYEELVLCGVIYYAEGQPAGFIVGDELNEETFALHFAKGKREFRGIYEYMFSTFAELLPRRYRLLNFEQDLGIEALRKAKSAYNPDYLMEKYRLSLK